MTGREGGGGCISPLHSIIQLQRDGEGRGERRVGGHLPCIMVSNLIVVYAPMNV